MSDWKQHDQGAVLVIAADDGGLYQISKEELIRAARRVPEDDPGYESIQRAADEGTMMTSFRPRRPPIGPCGCQVFNSNFLAQSFFINTRRGLDPGED